jgi:hypothetical protein
LYAFQASLIFVVKVGAYRSVNGAKLYVECLSFGKPFLLSLMFSGKARSLPWGGAIEKGFTQIAANLTEKH